jgi:predicted DNA-binding transcriptional regulator YafY
VGRTTHRVLTLLSLLQSRPTWSGPELAERLGVTTRCVRRDVQRLRDLGYPVHAAQGVAGGYRLGAGQALPPLLLDDDEAVAIAVSLRLATELSSEMGEVGVRALAKLDQVLPARLRGQVRDVHAATASIEVPAADGGLDVLLELSRACAATERVRFGYRAGDGTGSERRVEPYRVVRAARRWYLVAFDLDRDDWRTFRLDRVHDLERTRWRFAPRAAPDPVEYVRSSLAVSPYRFVLRARVHAPADEVRRSVPAATVTVTADGPDACLLESGGDDPDLIALHLARLPFELDVLGPDVVREAAARLAERCARLAGGATARS